MAETAPSVLSPGKVQREHPWQSQLTHSAPAGVAGISDAGAGLYKLLHPQMPGMQSWCLTPQIPLHCSGAGSVAHTWMQQLNRALRCFQAFE